MRWEEKKFSLCLMVHSESTHNTLTRIFRHSNFVVLFDVLHILHSTRLFSSHPVFKHFPDILRWRMISSWSPVLWITWGFVSTLWKRIKNSLILLKICFCCALNSNHFGEANLRFLKLFKVNWRYFSWWLKCS